MKIMRNNREDKYIHVPSFAIHDLKLKGNELLIFSIIHSFSRDGESRFYGSINYLCEMTNASRMTVKRVLDDLVAKTLILKEEIYKNGVKYCEYYSNLDYDTECYPGYQNVTGGIEMLPNNKILSNNKNNINKDNYNIKEHNDTSDKKAEKKKHTLEDTIKDLDEGIPIKSNKYALDYFRYYYQKVYEEPHKGNYTKCLGQIKSLNRDLGYGDTYNRLLFKLEEWMETWVKLDWEKENGHFSLDVLSAEWVRNKLDAKLNKNGKKSNLHDESDLKGVIRPTKRRIDS